jgi:CDP-diacylglycerol--glycerol-3-phosphate 3-phosphatidyltransferase
MEKVRILNKFFIEGFYSIVNPIGNLLESIRIHPHVVTVAGLIFSIISGVLFWKGRFVIAGFALIVSGMCDALDGRLARNTHRISPFGAIFDSTVDRYSEIAVFMGIMAYFNNPVISVMVILAIAGSLLTSYTRARAEGLNIECKIGLMQRPERLTFLATGAILGAPFDSLFNEELLLLRIALLGIAILSNITVIQRVVHVRNKLKSL